MLFLSVINTISKSNLGERVYFSLQVIDYCKGKPEQELRCRNPEAGTKAKTTEEHCLLACSQTHVHLLPYTAQAYLSRDGTAQHGLGLPISIISFEKYPTDRPQGILMNAIPQLRCPLSR